MLHSVFLCTTVFLSPVSPSSYALALALLVFLGTLLSASLVARPAFLPLLVGHVLFRAALVVFASDVYGLTLRLLAADEIPPRFMNGLVVANGAVSV